MQRFEGLVYMMISSFMNKGSIQIKYYKLGLDWLWEVLGGESIDWTRGDCT